LYFINCEIRCSKSLKSTCDVNLLLKLSIIFKEWSYCSLCTFKVPQGANNLILCTLDTIHRLCLCYKMFCLSIQWLDNAPFRNLWLHVLSLRIGECPSNSPFLKDNGARGPLFLRNGEIRGHFFLWFLFVGRFNVIMNMIYHSNMSLFWANLLGLTSVL
jgi:hypothetical protein